MYIHNIYNDFIKLGSTLLASDPRAKGDHQFKIIQKNTLFRICSWAGFAVSSHHALISGCACLECARGRVLHVAVSSHHALISGCAREPVSPSPEWSGVKSASVGTTLLQNTSGFYSISLTNYKLFLKKCTYRKVKDEIIFSPFSHQDCRQQMLSNVSHRPRQVR